MWAVASRWPRTIVPDIPLFKCGPPVERMSTLEVRTTRFPFLGFFIFILDFYFLRLRRSNEGWANRRFKGPGGVMMRIVFSFRGSAPARLMRVAPVILGHIAIFDIDR